MAKEDKPDEELARSAREALPGDLRSFEELVRRHQGRVLANCRFLTGSADDAQDLAQDVFVKAYFGIRGLRGDASFGGWVQRIKVNHCLNHLRKHKGRTFLDVDDPALESAPELATGAGTATQVDERDRLAIIRAVLDRLPDNLRVPLVMRDLDGFAYQEIADDLGLKLSAVKMRIKRGREEFRRIYGRLDPEDARHRNSRENGSHDESR